MSLLEWKTNLPRYLDREVIKLLTTSVNNRLFLVRRNHVSTQAQAIASIVNFVPYFSFYFYNQSNYIGVQNNDKNKEPPYCNEAWRLSKVSYTGQTVSECKECEPSDTGWILIVVSQCILFRTHLATILSKAWVQWEGMKVVAFPATALQFATHTHISYLFQPSDNTVSHKILQKPKPIL